MEYRKGIKVRLDGIKRIKSDLWILIIKIFFLEWSFSSDFEFLVADF